MEALANRTQATGRTRLVGSPELIQEQARRLKTHSPTFASAAPAVGWFSVHGRPVGPPCRTDSIVAVEHGCITKAPCGGAHAGPSPVDRGNRAASVPRRDQVIDAFLALAHAIITLRRLIRCAWNLYRWDARTTRRP